MYQALSRFTVLQAGKLVKGLGTRLVSITVVSRASAHGRSQLKHQKLGVGGYMEEVLEYSNYPRASVHPGSEVS